MRRLVLLLVLSGLCAWGEHSVVYEEAGRFGGWPANHGIWSWGNEILVGYSAGWFKKGDPSRHQMDASRGEAPMLSRSLDGGRTWKVEPFALPEDPSKAVILQEAIEFTNKNFAFKIRFVDSNRGPSLFYFSYDRGRKWFGPFLFPDLGLKGIAARTDYLVNGKYDCTVFLTAAKKNGKEGRPFAARTIDGGLTWNFVSYIAPEPSGFAIMPSTVRLSAKKLVTTVRVKGETANWIDAYASPDNGQTWQLLSKAAPSTGEYGGNPPSLLRLKDGRLAVIYGRRAKPFGMYARFSGDGGVNWGDERTIRDDGAWWDLGYPRSVQRPDGKIVTVYYFMHSRDTERYIAATIWDPGKR